MTNIGTGTFCLCRVSRQTRNKLIIYLPQYRFKHGEVVAVTSFSEVEVATLLNLRKLYSLKKLNEKIKGETKDE